MNEIKNDINKVTISDLKEMGKQGGATARLESGETVTLRKNYGTIKRPILIENRKVLGDVIVRYVDIYEQIRTVKRNNLLVARRVRQGKVTSLKLTGIGYNRIN
ncbi:hypothetical protein DIX59_10030 [Streptococcus iniae]|uniref:hypothetical protein n=1 Tax=Streptococcus iniae TaxID=1346 RepID=UPI000317BE37|nr:hypothetical protein [Streptococcus iniae]ESR10538.1 hypothetical protein IUSA1_01340 [Streptococcus iniae IUSA1]KYJ81220.1 hypothetical protein NA30_04275 [Streptococcus iniae]RMI72627.1 hypothetical protein DIX59_10030 [Streptococcus iniae]HEK4517247.1 hypothetical protein [Streptococcus iniae]